MTVQGFSPRPPHGIWGDRWCNRWQLMAVLCAQRRDSRTGNDKGELSVWRWHHLEARVQLHHLRGEVHLRAGCAGHPRSRGSWHLCARLSQSRCARMRCVEVDAVDLAHAGRQVTQEARPDLWVHSFTRGQEAGDFPDTLAESGSVFAQEWWVCAHSSWGEMSTFSLLLIKRQRTFSKIIKRFVKKQL